jgi:hypothetical protein
MIPVDGGANGPVMPVAEERAQASGRLVAFTWNVNRSPEALHLACRYLATQGSFVAALQELPEDDGQSLSVALGGSKLKCLSRAMLKPDDKNLIRAVDPSVVFIASDDIEIDVLGKSHEYKPELDSERRLEGLTLRSEVWQNLQVLGIHSWDRRSRPSEKKRLQWSALMGDALRTFWDGGPLIVLGDLNANPWSYEISSRDSLYALRRKDWPDRAR